MLTPIGHTTEVQETAACTHLLSPSSEALEHATSMTVVPCSQGPGRLCPCLTADSPPALQSLPQPEPPVQKHTVCEARLHTQYATLYCTPQFSSGTLI